MRADVERALIAGMTAMLGPLELVGRRATRWASATFEGMQVRCTLYATEAKAEALANLSDVDIALPGHFLADLRLVDQLWRGTSCTLTIEALAIVAD